MAFNTSTIKTSSDGLWQGENPLHYAFPLLTVQTVLVILTCRIVAFFLRPIRQPTVVAEIVGGIMLGPSLLGRNKLFMGWIFPPWSTPILESVASLGLLFFLFLVGLEIDLKAIRRRGKAACGIALAGISLPFIFGIGLTFLLRKSPAQGELGPNILFIGISLSITAFPVLARILAELKLLTTGVGETAMAAAALNDVVAWVLLALAVAVTGGVARGGALAPIWILLSGLTFVAFMLLVIRPGINHLVEKISSANDAAKRSYVVLILAGVMFCGFTTDLIGIHAIFGPFVLGLIIPKSGDFAGKLIKTIEDFVAVLLPLYFASTGLKTDVSKIRGGEAWGILVVVISAACAGKILGTSAVAMMCTIPVRESLALGVLMNTKGLVELIVLNIGREKKILDEKMFTILVMMALFTTFMTTPIVMAIYKPPKPNFSSNCQTSSSYADLRLLACVRGSDELPSLVTLLDSYTSPKTSTTTKAYVMQLVELTDRSSSIVMVQKTRTNGFPCFGRSAQGEFNRFLATAFEGYNQCGSGQVAIRQATSVSILSKMHEDICHVAEKKRAALIILPFHVQWKGETNGQIIEINLGQGWRGVNERVLTNAPCSIAVLIDRGFGLGFGDKEGPIKRVSIPFLGGPDSREALRLGGRMAEHPGMRITVIRFSISAGPKVEIKPEPLTLGPDVQNNNLSAASKAHNEEQEHEQDETNLAEFIQRWDGIVKLVEKETGNIMKELLTIARGTETDAIMVGKGRFPHGIAANVANYQVEYEELGQVGGLLASSKHGIKSSFLVVHQHDSAPDGQTAHL